MAAPRRIGILTYSVDPEFDQLIRAAINDMEANGVEVVEVTLPVAMDPGRSFDEFGHALYAGEKGAVEDHWRSRGSVAHRVLQRVWWFDYRRAAPTGPLRVGRGWYNPPRTVRRRPWKHRTYPS